MAVTKAQISNWSKAYDEKQRTAAKETATAGKTTGEKAAAAPLAAGAAANGTQRVSRSQIAQWSQKYSAQQQKQAEDLNLYAAALEDYKARNTVLRGSFNGAGADGNEPLSHASRASSPIEGSHWQAGEAVLEEQSRTGRESAGSATEGSRRSAMLAQNPITKWGFPTPQGQKNVLTDVGGGAQAYGTSPAQQLKASYANYNQAEDFDRLNQWFDTDDNRNLADAVRRVDSTNGAYTDADLIRNGGWTQEQINEARQKNAEYDAIPAWKRVTRRTANTAGGIVDTVAAAPVMGVEYLMQAGKNIRQSSENRKALEAEVAQNPREKNLYDRLMETDMDYQPKYSTGDLLQQGFTRQEIEDMRSRIAGTEAKDSIDPEESVGYQLWNRGQQLTGAAQSGLTDTQKTLQGVASSAAENLAVGAINPAAVLPVLSAQGAADAMGQAAAEGESAGKALAGGLAKFGAGWAINSVGAADLAKTMGSSYAKDTLAGQIADWVQGLVGDTGLAKTHPAVAAAISGGIDNAMQAFVETYADQAIDAALGDEKAAQTLFSKDTFLTALESGLSGGASGALGGAVGTGLARMNGGDASLRGQAERAAAEVDAERAAAKAAAGNPPHQSAAQTAVPQGEALGTPGSTELDAESSSGRKSEGPATEGSGVKYSIQTDDDGKKFVQVDGDFLEGVPEENWKNTVRDAIRDLFPNDFERGGQTIYNTREGRGEFVRSKYSRSLERTNIDTYADKLRMTPNLDEVISTSDNVQNEPANHKNGESFNRGKINIRIGDKDYHADVLTAIKQDGREVFYDVVDIQPTKINAPTETAEASASGNRSVKAGEDSRRTDTESVESSYRGLPGTSNNSIAPAGASVNGNSVENTGETVESVNWNRAEQKAAARQLAGNARMSRTAAQGVVEAMPQGVGATVYSQAANSLYQLGKMEDVQSFEQAVNLTGPESTTGGAVRQVLALGDVGENALRIAYTYGKGEAEAYNARKAAEIGSGKGAVNPDAGTYFKGQSVSKGGNALDAFIELGAKSSGTAIHRAVEGLKNEAKGYIRAAAGEMYLSGEADSETVMHETFHALNEWSPETGQAVMDRLLTYLVQQNGMESTEKLVESYLARYEAAGQRVTWNQALEEITADAMETVFGTEEAFRDFVRQQAAEAKMNASARGMIGKVMDHIQDLLNRVLADVNRFLKKEPTNAAAKAAKSLTEAQLKDLQALYFEHQAEAGSKYREAVETAKSGTETKNAASSETEDTAVKYSLPAMASETDAEKTKRQEALTIRPAQMNPERTARVSETDWSGQKLQDAKKGLRKIMREFGIIDKTYTINDPKVEFEYRTKTVNVGANHQSDITKMELNDFALVQANIEEVLKEAKPLEAHRNRKKNDHVEGMIVLASALQDGERIIPVKAEIRIYDDSATILYIALAETSAKDSSEAAQKRRTGSKVERNAASNAPHPPTSSSDLTITDFYGLVKDFPNFTKYFSDEFVHKAEQVEQLKQESQELGKQLHGLREERAAWLDSTEVKGLEAKKKSLGRFSAAAKEFTASEEYQAYLAKRKDFNQRGAALENRIGEVDDTLREANARLEARTQAIKEDEQLHYNVLAEKAGGKAEYRRQLALEQFGTTDEFERAGYILPDGKMLDFAQHDKRRDTDHREIMSVFGPTEVTKGTDALNKFLADGNVRVMAEAPGIDLAADKAPTAAQLEQIREMAGSLGSEQKKFTLDFSTANGKVAASKEYSGRIDADRIVREIREYYKTGELPAESSLAQFRYQLDVDSDAVEAAKAQGLGDVDKQTELVGQVVELGGKVRLSDESITGIVRAVLSDTNSRMSAKTLTERLRALSDYLAMTKNVSWEDANAFMTDIAEQIMLKSSKKNDELWRQYPELHQMSMTIEKGSVDYKEILYRWGSWANARKELARHGVKITQSKEGVHSRWDADFTELQKLGAGLLPTETPNSAVDALEAMAAAHDTIRPVMENAYDEDWNGAKQDIAMQLWQRYMNSPEVANEQNAQARKEFTQQWEEVRKQARQEAQEARAKAVMKLTEKRLNDAAWAGRELAKRSEAERARRDAQIDKVRTAREMDNTRRAIRRLTTQLNGIITKDKAGSSVPSSIASQVLEVAKLANENIRNKKMLDEIGKLSRMIHTSAEAGERDRVGMEWLNSGLEDAITDWMTDVNDSRELALARTEKEIGRVNKRLEQLMNAAEKTGQDHSKDIADLNAYASHLEQRRTEYADGGMARLTSDQLRGLRNILEETIHIVRNENKLLGEEYQEAIDTFADGMTKELREAKGTNFGNTFAGKAGRKLASYKLNTMNIQRMFERMGGYVHGGYMEKAGKMLNDGQYKKTRLIVEGTAFFDNVTGPGSLKKMDRFSHELIDIGLRDDAGKAVKITREQAVALYFQCQNLQGLHHMTHGGLKVMNMEYAVKGDTEMAKHYAETVRIGDLKFDEAGHMLDRTGANVADEAEQWRQLDGQKREFLAELEKALFTGDMADYCKLWIEDYKAFEQWTKKNINETSMILNGRAKATVENYIPLHVDEDTNVKKNEGIRYDNSVGSEGFLKQRVPSGKPIWLDGIGSVVNTSLENVAQYAGMAIPLRNIQKLMNTQLDGKTLYAAVNQTWGAKGEQYLTQAISDLHPQRGTANLGDSSLAKLRSRAAAAVLTANLNVTFLQAASLPTAAAELGWKSTGAAAIQFGKNIDPVNKLLGAVGLSENKLNAIEQEISEHGDALLQYRLRGTRSGELGSLGEMRGLLGKAHDALLDSDSKLIRGGTQFADDLAGSITKMDEITVAALWEGAKSYVKNNPSEFAAEAASIGSAAYWEAVNQQYQRVVERTQPNYTTMQRTGFQRTGNDMMKTLMMFSTQRQQNAQIWVSAAEDYMAQKRRVDAAEADLAKATADNDEHWMKTCTEAAEKAQREKSTAGKRLIWAITSQAVQTATIAAIGMGVKLLLHRRKDLQDENGDITLKSAGGAFGKAFLESLVGNFVGGSELYTAVAVILGGTDYDTVSLTGISTVNDTVAAISSLVKEIMKDTSELDEEDRAKHDARVQKDILDLAGSISQFYGIPFNNVKKYFEAAAAYAKDVQDGTLLDFSDLPESATGQYDRLYTAIADGDTDNAAGAMEKLEAMGKDEKTITSQLKNRLKKYDEDLLKAAEEQNAGKSSAAFTAKMEVFERLRAAYGVKAAGERGATAEDAARRSEFIDLVNDVVDTKAEELYKGGTGGSIYDALTEAVNSGRATDVQAEVKRLRTAGKDDGNIKTKITAAVKEEYLAGNDRDRERLETMLLKLTKADGSAMYEKKNFTQWVRDAEKKEESAKNEKDEWAAVR